MISDYCCREGEWSDKFTSYVKQRGYFLLSVEVSHTAGTYCIYTTYCTNNMCIVHSYSI